MVEHALSARDARRSVDALLRAVGRVFARAPRVVLFVVKFMAMLATQAKSTVLRWLGVDDVRLLQGPDRVLAVLGLLLLVHRGVQVLVVERRQVREGIALSTDICCGVVGVLDGG